MVAIRLLGQSFCRLAKETLSGRGSRVLKMSASTRQVNGERRGQVSVWLQQGALLIFFVRCVDVCLFVNLNCRYIVLVQRGLKGFSERYDMFIGF